MILPTPSGVEHMFIALAAIAVPLVMILPTPSGVEHRTFFSRPIVVPVVMFLPTPSGVEHGKKRHTHMIELTRDDPSDAVRR